mgnify:CR=1 FL=1
MSKLSERCEQRKAEAQALADKFNALDAEEKKAKNEKAQIYAEFQIKNAQYAELLAQVKEEESAEQPTAEVIE